MISSSELAKELFETIKNSKVNVYDLRVIYPQYSDVAINNVLIRLMLADKIRMNMDSLKYMVVE